MIATVRFDRGELDLVLASLITYGKEHPDQKVIVDKLIRRIRRRRERVEGKR